MPWYYVSQVLLEMVVLKVDKLLFMCYIEESSTVFEAPFDGELWEKINNRINSIYGSNHPDTLKRLPAGNKKLIRKNEKIQQRKRQIHG